MTVYLITPEPFYVESEHTPGSLEFLKDMYEEIEEGDGFDFEWEEEE